MRINQEANFNQAPTVNAPRSKFLMHQNIRTTFNAGELIPFYVDSDIMPGDTFKVKGTFVVRQSTPIYPTMDNTCLDVFFFFIPHRLVWNHWKAFWGENETGAWAPSTSYTIPQYVIGKTNTDSGIEKGSIANYMGLPIINTGSNGTKVLSVNALPFRAYQAVWNDFFRDENVAAPQAVYKGDSDSAGVAGNDQYFGWGKYSTSAYNNYQRIPKTPAPVYKIKDYFNACLPEPQKGNPVTLPIGQTAPVEIYGNGMALGITNGTDNAGLGANDQGDLFYNKNDYGKNVGQAPTTPVEVFNSLKTIGLTTDSEKSGIAGIADLSNAVAATINAQRMAFAAQRILEAKARTGSRYFEICGSIFQVHGLSNMVQQRPEYLGGKRIPITMNQVAQTSSTDNTSPQGNVAAYSLTVDSDHIWTKSFTEHGTVLGVLCVRQNEHSYDQGIARQWSRKEVLDFYTPQMAFLGEQAILNKEIYATGTSQDDEVFGYNERWAELRYKPNINTGAFSTQYSASLDSWHYGDSYNSLPVLSDNWRRETKSYIDRTLAVTSAVEDQYLMDSRLEFEATRCMPLASIPGLLDHF